MVELARAAARGRVGIPAAKRSVQTLLRTVETMFPRLQPLKERSQSAWRSATRRPHERDFRALRLLPRDATALVLDVGANTGQSIQSVRLFWPDAEILAFEPNPALAERLESPSDHSLTVSPRALGRRAGTSLLYVPEYNGWVFHGLASLDRDEAASWLRGRLWRYRESLLVVHEIAVETVRLDDVAAESTPSLIKIDTQGTETDVIAGGRETIARCRPTLLVECGRFERELRQLLEPIGYRPFVYQGDRFEPGDRGALNTFFIAR